VKDEKIKINKEEIKIRKKFPGDFNPAEKIERVKTDYKRSQNKNEIQRALEEAEEESKDLDNWL
jgi:hypothetical protein